MALYLWALLSLATRFKASFFRVPEELANLNLISYSFPNIILFLSTCKIHFTLEAFWVEQVRTSVLNLVLCAFLFELAPLEMSLRRTVVVTTTLCFPRVGTPSLVTRSLAAVIPTAPCL